MPQFRKKAGLARLAAWFVVVNLLLVACGAADNSATATSQVALAATPTIAQTTYATTLQATTKSVFSGLAQGKLKEMVPALANLAAARKFRIEDDFTSLSTGGPEKAHYSFELKNGQFEGEGIYSIGGYTWVEQTSRPYYETTRPITIPLDVGQKFLQILADASVEDGPYKGKPATFTTDNYPNRHLYIETESGLLEFRFPAKSNYEQTSSFFFAGREFNATDYSAWLALDLLKPYLHREMLQTLGRTPGTTSPAKTPLTPNPRTSPTVKK